VTTRFARGAADAAVVMLGVIPWLLLAACLEVFNFWTGTKLARWQSILRE